VVVVVVIVKVVLVVEVVAESQQRVGCEWPPNYIISIKSWWYMERWWYNKSIYTLMDDVMGQHLAHLGIVHADIKPDNILVSENYSQVLR